MTKRLTISIDDDVYDTLEVWADEEVRTIANLAAAIVTLEARKRQAVNTSESRREQKSEE
jgi:hypothetical protein